MATTNVNNSGKGCSFDQGRVAAGRVHDTEDRVAANEVPGEDRRAAVRGIARLGSIEARPPSTARAAVELIDVDALAEFGGGTRWRAGPAETRRSCDSVVVVAGGSSERSSATS